MIEKNNELLLRNHQSHSTGFVPLLEATVLQPIMVVLTKIMAEAVVTKIIKVVVAIIRSIDQTTRSGIIVMRSKKKIYKRNLQRIMKMFA